MSHVNVEKRREPARQRSSSRAKLTFAERTTSRVAAAKLGRPLRIEIGRLATLEHSTRSGSLERQLRNERVLRVLVGASGSAMLRGTMPPLVIVPLRRSIRVR